MIYLHTTYPTKISPSSHYALKRQLYYPRCPNPFRWFSIIQPHALLLLCWIATLPHHPHIYHWSLYTTRPPFPWHNANSTCKAKLYWRMPNFSPPNHFFFCLNIQWPTLPNGVSAPKPILPKENPFEFALTST